MKVRAVMSGIIGASVVIMLAGAAGGGPLIGQDWTVRADSVMGPSPRAADVCVRRDGGQFVTWANDGLGTQNVQYATSPDGTAWGPRQTVYTPAQVDDSCIKVVIKDGGYYMWVGPKPSPGNGGAEFVTSNDGINWQKQSFIDDRSWYYFSVLQDGDGFVAWYTADGPHGYTRATSSNGSDWTGQGVVLQPGSSGQFDADLNSVDVVMVGAEYHMFYGARPVHSGPTRLAHATSADGISWVKQGLVTGLESFGDSMTPSVIYDEGKLRMWFNQSDGEVYYAESVPGPAGLLLLAIGGLALIRRRRYKQHRC